MTQTTPDLAPAQAVPAPMAARSDLLSRIAAWTSERSNPIVVRYARQQLRSRGFIIVFSKSSTVPIK